MPDTSDLYQDPGAFRAIADKCGLSERTIRNAFANKPITWQTACRIAKHLGIRAASFRIKVDRRGKRKDRP